MLEDIDLAKDSVRYVFVGGKDGAYVEITVDKVVLKETIAF